MSVIDTSTESILILIYSLVPDSQINEKAVKHGNWKLPWAWDFFVKYLNPPILSGLIVNEIFSNATDYDGAFYNYPGWVQADAITLTVVLVVVFIIIAVCPSVWGFIAGREEITEVETVVVEDQMTNEYMTTSCHQLKTPILLDPHQKIVGSELQEDS